MKKKLIVIALVMFIIGGLIYLSFNTLVLTLIGEEKIELELGQNYEELGYKAKILNLDISKDVKIDGTVDVNNVGIYEIKYTIKKIFNKKVRKRIIEVKEKKNEIKEEKTEVNEEKPTVEKPKNNQETSEKNNKNKFYTNIIEGPTYIKGILIVNKNYNLPSGYGGNDETALSALKELQSAAKENGYSANLVSGYRSYESQKSIYNGYVKRWGKEYTDTVSARPGHSEHQTGLAFDVGTLNSDYGKTNEGIWLEKNCHKYGFILRYPKGREHITGYAYEPWHIRYVGIDAATYIMENNITLEEYLGIA